MLYFKRIQFLNILITKLLITSESERIRGLFFSLVNERLLGFFVWDALSLIEFNFCALIVC